MFLNFLVMKVAEIKADDPYGESRLRMVQSFGYSSVEAYESAYRDWAVKGISDRIFLRCMELMKPAEA